MKFFFLIVLGLTLYCCIFTSCTKDDFNIQPIIFSGDRLDELYKNFAASWLGIYFRETCMDNLLQFTFVKNAHHVLVD